jgi:hypothetical protein
MVCILRVLSGLSFRTCCDVGAGEGYTTAALVKALMHPERPAAADLSLEAVQRAHELFEVLLAQNPDAAASARIQEYSQQYVSRFQSGNADLPRSVPAVGGEVAKWGQARAPLIEDADGELSTSHPPQHPEPPCRSRAAMSQAHRPAPARITRPAVISKAPRMMFDLGCEPKIGGWKPKKGLATR